MNRKKIIQAAIGLVGLVTSFLPQQVLAASCGVICPPPYGSCSVEADTVFCDCVPWALCYGENDP